MPTVWSVTIGGVERDCALGSLNIQEVANGVNTMRAAFKSVAGAFRPALGADIVITRDAVRVWGGFVDKTAESGADGQPIDDIETLVDSVAYNSIGERRFVYETIAAGSTLKQALQQLEPYVTPYGVSLSGSQVNGPTLPEVVIDGDRFIDVINRLSQLTGFIGGIDYNKSLRMVQFGDLSAPFNVIDGDGNHVGDITVERSREKYFNRVVLKYGKAGPLVLQTEAHTGNGVLATFPVELPVAGPFAPVATEDGAIAYGVVNYNDGTTESIGGQSAPAGFLWEYDPDANTITRRSGAVGNTVGFVFRYDAQFPQTVIVEDASEISLNGLYETVVVREDIFDKTEATETAETYLSQFLQILTTVKFDTYGAGLHPGQTITLTIADRNVNGQYLITEVKPVNPNTMQDLRYSVTAIDSETFRGSFRQLYKDWLNTGSKSASTGPAAAGGGAPFPPNRAVQFNDGGAFGGNVGFLFYKDEVSLVCGDLSSIDAANFDGCQAFGYDCHIGDT